MGTLGSSLICQKCKPMKSDKNSTHNNSIGLVMEMKDEAKLEPKNVEKDTMTDEAKVWKCNSCGSIHSEQEVENVCLAIHHESEQLINSAPDRSSISKYEAFIQRYSGSILHPNHMLLANLKYSLSGFYGRLPGYEMQDMNNSTLARKKQICEETLQVLNRIDPGISPRRGMVTLPFVLFYHLFHISMI